MKRAISLCFILIWSLSTARSFQPVASPASSSSSSTSSSSTIHKPKDLSCAPLQVSAAASGTGARRLLQDWAGRIGPVQSSTTSSIRNRKKSVYEPCSSSSSSTNLDYQRAKEEWADRYTNLDSLRATFGANRNKVWGDLDPATARRLYKTLLPKALLELVKVGVQPQDLAPLAYQARVAAKLYARERCHVPARVFCQLFDGMRQFKKYGKFQPCGMSYDQVWEKYHSQLRTEEDLTEQDVTAKICLKILERSCVTNEGVDKWVLPPDDPEQREDLVKITETLENDVRKLLLDGHCNNGNNNNNNNGQRSGVDAPPVLSLRKYRTLRMVARARRRAAGHHHKKQQQQLLLLKEKEQEEKQQQQQDEAL